MADPNTEVAPRLPEIRELAQGYGCEVVTRHFIEDYRRTLRENDALRRENASLLQRVMEKP